jgi:hypothetical protein
MDGKIDPKILFGRDQAESGIKQVMALVRKQYRDGDGGNDEQ